MIQRRERQLLYVDDTEEQRYAMRRILEQAGYVVVEAGTGAEALSRLHPEILAVILDVKLPDMSGYEVCRRIKAAPATAAIPVLQVSASFADPLLRAAGLSGGVIRSHDLEKTLRFQAEVSARLSASLDYEETLKTVEQAFLPRFADRCYAVMKKGERAAAAGLGEELLAAAAKVRSTGLSQGVGRRALVVPLEVGPKRLGVLVFTVDGERRWYTAADVALGEDLADRAALALQNASLYSAQQAAQKALIQSEKLAAAGRLSAAIAHEINNPLESITNLLYLIDTSEGITPSIKGYAQEALSELGRLPHIARQSLGFYRELTGAVEFDLNESVDETVSIYAKRFEAKSIEVERRYVRGPLLVRAVKGEVRQVVSNLLVNAYDALQAGGRLLVETDRCGESGKECVVLRVTDTGSGIAPEVLTHVFEPFFTTKAGTGTGLGLWVSETIVEKHGGSISVKSRTEGAERGTTFEVTLPRQDVAL